MNDESPQSATTVPMNRSQRRCHRGIFVPLLLIGLGVVFLLDQYHLVDAGNIFAYFWPVIFIAFGLDTLQRGRAGRNLLWGVGAIAVGVAWIYSNLGYWNFDIGRLWPLLLIAFGFSLLFGGPRRRLRHRGGSEDEITGAAWSRGGDSSGDTLDGVACLGGIQRRITTQSFRGGRVVACFGGFNVDLTRADIAGDSAEIDLNALFGGGEVRVPNTWIIEMQGNALLGGYTDETHQVPAGPNPKRLIVQGTAIFGGVVIKN